MAPGAPSTGGREEEPDDLRDLDLPWFPRLALRLEVVVLEVVLRLTDLLLLFWRPRLLWAYLAIWWAELRHTPYRARRTFEVVRAQKATGQRFRELIYGETPLITALSVLREAGVGRGSVVLDLGAGRGRLLIAARWLGARARGVELLADHVSRVAGPLSRVGISLEMGDMLKTPLEDATHVFTNWLALSPQTERRLVEHLRSCRAGTRILTVTRPIEGPGFARLGRRWRLFTWGVEPVWLHEARPDKDGPAAPGD